MLTILQAAQTIVATQPLFEAAWLEYSAVWGVDGDSPFTLIFSDLGTLTARAASELSDDELRIIFEAVELVLTDGDEPARNAAATGFLEAVISGTDNSPALQQRLRTLMGTRSRCYCEAWDDFTLGPRA
jgi:hypothetical protein